MSFKNTLWRLLIGAAILLSLTAACGTPPEATPVPTEDVVDATATATPTPTPAAGAAPTPSSASSPCAGLSGELEVQVLVGPAEAVGLEPVAVGNVPIAVVSETPPYIVEGAAPISYEAVLEQEWGTYAVTLDMDIAVDGECGGAEGAEQLLLTVRMSGEQMVVVDAEGFHGEYPWAGESARDVAFPLVDGATAEGEGWAFVLHLSGSAQAQGE